MQSVIVPKVTYDRLQKKRDYSEYEVSAIEKKVNGGVTLPDGYVLQLVKKTGHGNTPQKQSTRRRSWHSPANQPGTKRLRALTRGMAANRGGSSTD